MRRAYPVLLSLALAVPVLTGCGGQTAETTSAFPDATSIVLSDDGVTVDGEAAPADETAAVYTAHDIVYYEAGRDFTYGEGTEADEHTAEEAAAHTVVHITQPGTYAVSGTLSAGQIAVDLGEDAEDDQSAVVTLILNGVDITCTVAPAVIFYSVYECGSTDEDTAAATVDTSAAGANVLIADGTVNNVTGSYVARIYEPDSVVLSEDGTEVADSSKLHKYDGAFYSKMSMNVGGGEDGSGVLNITADNEGLDTELHLTINGGTVMASGNMYDQIDGGDQTYEVFSFASRQTGGETYTLQDADGGTVGTWTPVNDFTWQYGQHSVAWAPGEEEGVCYLRMFNNNYWALSSRDGYDPALPEGVSTELYGGEGDYSYTYVYRIDENAGTVELVESFPVPYSSIVSNSTLNEASGHWAVNSGIAMVFGEYDAGGALIRQYDYECTMQGYRTFKYDYKGFWFQ